MTTISTRLPVANRGVPTLPPLQAGDHLGRAEFERRYERMPGLKKAELVEGVVQMAPPVSFRGHSNPHFNVIAWLGQYCTVTPHVEGGDNASLRLDLNNEPQPDAFLIISPRAGGQVRIDHEDYVVGAPELVVEVAASTASYDLHTKLDVYRRNGVREYVVWRVFDRAIDWFALRTRRFEALPLTDKKRYESEVLPGLWLDPLALLRADLPVVMDVLREGTSTAAHTEFVKRLRKATTSQRRAMENRRRKRPGP